MNGKKQIKIYFTDFWPNFEPKNNIFYNLLKERYDVEITPDNPDYLFFSVFGTKFNYFKCIRIFFTGENIRPDFNVCDYAFCFDMPRNNPRLYRLPQYYQYGDMEELTDRPSPEDILKTKTKFCNFVYSNPNCKKRNDFFKKLNKYKKVDSAGRYMNNIGRNIGMTVEDKWEFLKPYKFTIAFENEERNYYTSEKIFEAMKVDSLPIYWGNPKVDLDFNPKSFLNYYDYGSDEALIERIIEIDRNDDLYLDYLRQPYFYNNEPNEFVKKENILNQLDYILSNDIEPTAYKSPIFSDNPIIRNISKAKIEAKYKMSRFSRRASRFNFNKIKLKLHKIKHKQEW